MSRAIASLQPGWMVLTHCAFGSPAEPPARVRYALVHPKVGVALLDVVPDRPAPEPVERLRRALEALGFRAIFGGWPPIVYRRLAPGQLPDLGIALAAAFALEGPLTLGGGDAWVGGVLRALTTLPEQAGDAPALVAEPRGRDRSDEAHAGPAVRVPRREAKPIPVRALMCGCLVVSALGGTLLLPSKPWWPGRTEPATPSAPLPDLDLVAVPVRPLPVPATAQPLAGDSPDMPRVPTRRRPATARPGDRGRVNEHCQAVVPKTLLGKEPPDADRPYLRHGCLGR